MSNLTGGAMALSSDGTMLAIAQATDILTYDASTDEPKWLHGHSQPIVALHPLGDDFIVLDVKGTVFALNAETGHPSWSLPGVGKGHGLAVSSAGTWGALIGAELYEGKGDKVARIVPIDSPHTGAVAFAGAVPAVALQSGKVCFYPEKDDAVDKQLPFAVTALTSTDSAVLGACGHHCVRVDMEGGKALCTFEETDVITGVDVSRQGEMMAIRVGDTYLAVMDKTGGRQLAHANFADRVPGTACFTRKGDLWVAVGEGHACALRLSDGGVRRTDEHPGRPRGSWMVSVSIDEAAEDEAMAAEEEADKMDNMPLWARIGLSVFAVVVVVGGCIGANILLQML